MFCINRRPKTSGFLWSGEGVFGGGESFACRNNFDNVFVGGGGSEIGDVEQMIGVFDNRDRISVL